VSTSWRGGGEAACDELVAALDRERSDRGLTEAADRAEASQVFVSTSTGPRRWRSAAELDRAEARAKVAFATASHASFVALEEAPERDRADREAAADRARDAYLLRERHRAVFERPLGRSPSRGREGPGIDL
jgi:hypothetical protein